MLTIYFSTKTVLVRIFIDKASTTLNISLVHRSLILIKKLIYGRTVIWSSGLAHKRRLYSFFISFIHRAGRTRFTTTSSSAAVSEEQLVAYKPFVLTPTDALTQYVGFLFAEIAVLALSIFGSFVFK